MKEKLKELKELILLLPAAGILALVLISTNVNQFTYDQWPNAASLIEAQAAEDSNSADQSEDSSAAAGETTEETSSKKTKVKSGDFKDGTYEGSGKGFGGDITVSVTIKGGKIKSVKIISAPGETSSFLSKAEGLIPSIISKQSPDVDGISGATYSSNGIKTAVANALNQAVKDSSKKVSVTTETADDSSSGSEKEATEANTSVKSGTFKDGTYTGSGTGFGGNITVSVTVKGGKITAVKVVSAPGETASFLSKAKGLIPSILKKQSPDVDGISGATYSSNGIKTAVANALNKAVTDSSKKVSANTDKKKKTSTTKKKTDNTTKKKTKKTTPKTESGLPKDGTYTGTGTVENFDYTMTMNFKFKNGKLVAVSNLKVSDDEDSINASFWEKAYKPMIQNLLKAQSSNVDTVSGATYSSNAIIEAYVNAYNKAVKANSSSNKSEEKETEQETESVKETESQTESETAKETETSDQKESESESQAESETEDTRPKISGVKDGTYKVSTTVWPDEYEDFYEYTLTAEYTFANERLTNITIVSLSDNSNLPFCKNALTKGDKKTSSILTQLTEKQSDSGISAISGATCSSDAFVELFKLAVKEAKK